MSLKNSIFLVLAVWNFIVFFIYGLDKNKAERGAWRIPEKALLLESICLGGLGAFLGGKVFHHKTRKWYFQVCWYLGIIIDAVFVYLVWRM